MEILYNLGMGDSDINAMLELCPNIKDMSSKEIEEKVYLLQKLECTEKQIRNIIISNPMYLDRTNGDIIELVRKLMSLNISCLNIVFDSYPYLLNKDAFEIDEYIKQEIKMGKTIDDIIDELESTPYLIDEI